MLFREFGKNLLHGGLMRQTSRANLLNNSIRLQVPVPELVQRREPVRALEREGHLRLQEQPMIPDHSS